MKKLVLRLLATACALSAVITAPAQSTYNPYSFTTFAGNPPGSTDGTGSAARFNGPYGTGVDSAGNVYVADSDNSMVRKITPTGVVTTLAGLAANEGSADGVGSAARFDSPDGVAVDDGGNVYWLATRAAPTALHIPRGLAVSNTGNVYVADNVNDTIRVGLAAAALDNISTRLSVGTGDNILIGGFIVTGTQPKKVIVRAIGPLWPLSGALADPLLELHDSSGQMITTNDNWQDSPERQAIIDSTIAPTNDNESAILMTLEPGAYTAVMRGVNNGTGVGLVEVYDLDSTVDSRLANISARGFVQTDDDVMIGGFIIGGSAPANVLVRAIGPELTAKRVAGALQDTTLELHDSNGALLSSNDDWGSDQKQAIIDTTVPPTDPRESAIMSTLATGAYTAIVQGKNNTTGVALVEAYVLP